MGTLNTTNIWDSERECMPAEDLEQLQFERLVSTLNRAYENVDFSRRVFDRENVNPADIRSLSDIRHLPFTTKDDFRENYPYGMFAVPMRDIVRIHSSSGTTGKPTVVGYTRRDLETWSALVARMLRAGGVSADDVIQIAFGYGLFTGGFGLHYGAEKLGASVIPMSSGNTQKQLLIMRDYHSSVLICTPSYALYLAESMQAQGIDPRELHLRRGLFGAEPWSDQMRAKIEQMLGIDAFDNYGLSEVMGPGVAYECECKDGMHVSEDHFLVEIVDPESLCPVEDGEWGEIVLTSLTKEGLPVIRYRTRDISRIMPQSCACGRTSRRIAKPCGRSDDMLIIRGVNVFPSQIEEVLCNIESCEPHYRLVVERRGSLDMLQVLVEVNQQIFFDEMKKQNALVRQIQSEIKSVTGVSAEVRIVERRTLERFEGKSSRVEDRRSLGDSS